MSAPRTTSCKIVRGLRDEGIGVVVVSTEPETVLSLADRILVMKKGEIVREFAERDGQQGPAPRSGVRGSGTMTAPADGEVRSAKGGLGNWLKGQLRNIAPFVTLTCLVVFFSVASPSFLTLDNLWNILTNISVTGIIAVGLTFVILCAEIDLSVAAIANATGIVVAFFTLQPDYVNIANLPLPGRGGDRARAPRLLRARRGQRRRA